MFPKEICGLIYFNQETYRFDIFSCKNRAKNKNDSFIISPQDYLSCSKLGKITACYHSHSNDNLEFSQIDTNNSNLYNIYYLLYNVKFDIFKFYSPNEHSNNYIGRPFILGKSDCFTLMKEYAYREHKITINFPNALNYPRSLEDINDMYEKNFIDAGFIKLTKGTELKKSDGLMMLFPNVSDKYPTHAAVYLGDNTILHQPFNSFSCVNIYDNFFKKHTSYVLRHRSCL